RSAIAVSLLQWVQRERLPEPGGAALMGASFRGSRSAPLRQALVKLKNDSVRVLEQAGQHLSPRRLAVSDRIRYQRRHQDRHAGRLELLHFGAQILDPKGKVMDPDLIQLNRLARRRTYWRGKYDETCLRPVLPAHIHGAPLAFLRVTEQARQAANVLYGIKRDPQTKQVAVKRQRLIHITDADSNV